MERQRKGISASELAKQVGLTKATISRYENGVIQMIPIRTLRQIVDALECDFDAFVSEDPKYCSLASESFVKPRSSLSRSDQEQRILWYENLPPELQSIIKQLWKIPVKV